MFVPRVGRTLATLPKALGMLFKRPDKQLELFALGCVHAFMHCVQNFSCLLKHCQRSSDRHIGLAFANLLLRRAANSHAGLRHVVYKRHQRPGGLLVGQRHNGLAQRHAAGLNQRSAAGRDAEDVGVLSRSGIRQQEAGEVGVHACIKKLTPRGCNRVGSVTQNVQQTYVIEPHTGDKGILHKVSACFRQFVF